MNEEQGEMDASLFAKDVLNGLQATPKRLSSKYFYDETGSHLFQQIMALPEYYLTRTELGIIEQFKDQFLSAFKTDGRPFRMVELGAGDGLKTKVLLEYFVQAGLDFQYVPVDISTAAIEELKADLSLQLPDLSVLAVHATYKEALQWLQTRNDAAEYRLILLFMGSNIGNLTRPEAVGFLSELSACMRADDLFLLGVDLKKDARKILAAYDDAKGITAAFNLNLLHRINKELGADFNVDNFLFFPGYDPQTGELRSFLQSTCQQTVHISKLGVNIELEAWEAIYTEVSKKYSLSELAEIAMESGFGVVENYLDGQQDFVISLWNKKRVLNIFTI